MEKPELKLTLLMPSQVAGDWRELIERAVAVGFAPLDHPKGVATVMHQLERGRYMAFVLGARLGEPEQTAVAVAICYRVLDEATGQYVLFLWALLGIEALGKEDWQDGFRLLREEARKRNCIRIEAVSDNPRVIDLVTELGGNADKRLIRLEA